jgi:hypothetical protein
MIYSQMSIKPNLRNPELESSSLTLVTFSQPLLQPSLLSLTIQDFVFFSLHFFLGDIHIHDLNYHLYVADSRSMCSPNCSGSTVFFQYSFPFLKKIKLLLPGIFLSLLVASDTKA